VRQEWIDWFIDYSNNGEWSRISKPDNAELKREYDWLGVDRDEVPFDQQLDEYIRGVIGNDNYLNNGYILIRYGVGDYIGEHVDEYNNTQVTYVYELQASECGTGLTIEGTPVTEGYYYNTVRHEVKPIKAGTRISLTMFGRKVTSLL